jgi:hypothetical protein
MDEDGLGKQYVTVGEKIKEFYAARSWFLTWSSLMSKLKHLFLEADLQSP